MHIEAYIQNIGVWFIERYVYVLCPTLCNPLDCSLPGSSVNFQARILELVALSTSKASSLNQKLNPNILCFLHYRWILYPLSHKEAQPVIRLKNNMFQPWLLLYPRKRLMQLKTVIH